MTLIDVRLRKIENVIVHFQNDQILVQTACRIFISHPTCPESFQVPSGADL
jgi:hypothetical protein